MALLVNYPGTIASCWQQAGRSGRRQEESLAVLLAGNDPVDQYLLRRPDYFFAQSPEHAVVDPDNPYVLAKHLQAAAFELPLDAKTILRRSARCLDRSSTPCVDEERLTEVRGAYYHPGGQNPTVGVSLRHMSDNTFSIVSTTGRAGAAKQDAVTVLANVDAISASGTRLPGGRLPSQRRNVSWSVSST